jgi:amidase
VGGAQDGAFRLPVGVQLVAARFREDLLFDAAEVIEARHPCVAPIDPIWS